MEQFKIKPGGFNEIRKQLLIKTTSISIIAAGVGVGLGISQNNESDINVLPFLIPFVLLALGIGFFRTARRQRKLFESFTLSISDDAIIRNQENTPTIKIAFIDLNEIFKAGNGSFIIKGRTSRDVIIVPVQIENYEQLETKLNQIRPVKEAVTKGSSTKFVLPIIVGTMGLFATVVISTNEILVGISGTLLTGIFIHSFILTQRSKNIDHKSKRSSFWVILLLFVIIGTTLFKLGLWTPDW